MPQVPPDYFDDIKLMTPKEVCKVLMISRQTLWDLVKKHKIPFVDLTPSTHSRKHIYRFKPEEIKKFIGEI